MSRSTTPWGRTNGQSQATEPAGDGALGWVGLWTAWNTSASKYPTPSGFTINNAATGTLWNGGLVSLPPSPNGVFAGSPAPSASYPASGNNGNDPDHQFAASQLDPSVTSTFVAGNTTWISFAEETNFAANANGTGAAFALGSGTLDHLASVEGRTSRAATPSASD